STLEVHGLTFTLPIHREPPLSEPAATAVYTLSLHDALPISQLTAAMLASDVPATPTTHAITVFNPTPGGGVSPTSVTLNVVNGPTLTADASTPVAGGSSVLTVASRQGNPGDCVEFYFPP